LQSISYQIDPSPSPHQIHLPLTTTSISSPLHLTTALLATALLTLQVVYIPLEDLVGDGQEMESMFTKAGGIGPPSQKLSPAGMQRVAGVLAKELVAALGSGDGKGKGKRMD
jgi:hypothetical protein